MRRRHSAAMSHPLVAAVIAELPRIGDEFPAAQRESWLSLLRHAFSSVYGAAIGTPEPVPSVAAPVAAPPRRFYVAPNGQVMCNGAAVKFHDVPAGAILWDERVAPDRGYDLNAPPQFGRTDNIEWADIGTEPHGLLPRGVTMKTAPHAAAAVQPADPDQVLT
jgi:hypothetical protein